MEVLQKTEEYVEMNELTLNTNKTELIFFSHDIFDFGSISLQKQISHNRKKWQISWYSNWQESNFDEQLNKTLKKITHAIRSIYLIRHRIPPIARILLL